MVRRFWLFTVLFILFSVASVSFSENKNSDSEILLGMSTALTGPTANLGEKMQLGVLAAINEINAKGGINGRHVALITLDDGYEPKRTIVNVNKLVNEHQVLCIVGNVGTPTAVAAVPIINQHKVLFYGAFTGAGLLRMNPPNRYIINYRASYAEETSEMVDQLLSKGGIKPEEIAFFTQRDSYGDAGYQGALAALKRHGFKDGSPVAHGRYERNTLAVEKGLVAILLHEPKPRAVIMVGAYAPCAEFIRLARENDFNPIFLNVSFVGAESLADELGKTGDGTIVMQVVPHYNTKDIPILEEYRSAIEAMAAEPSFVSLEGYVAGRILLKALDSIRGQIDRETVIDALQGLGEFDIGLGHPLKLNEAEHQACHTVWPTVIRGGKVEIFDWNDLPKIAKEQD